jgi:hypothetical protein
VIEVLNVIPAVGPVGATQAIQFDVRTANPDTFVGLIVGVFYAGAQMQEFAFAGDPAIGDAGFLPLFSANSTIAPVVDAGYSRFRVTLVRLANGGNPIWLDNPRIEVFAYNSAGGAL